MKHQALFSTNMNNDIPKYYIPEYDTVKPVISGCSKIDKTKVLKTNGSLMKVETIAECSLGAFCNTFDMH